MMLLANCCCFFFFLLIKPVIKQSTSFFSFSGEFTLRAYLNGRLDLSQAENVEKLIVAKSVAAADAALAGLQACNFCMLCSGFQDSV